MFLLSYSLTLLIDKLSMEVHKHKIYKIEKVEGSEQEREKDVEVRELEDMCMSSLKRGFSCRLFLVLIEFFPLLFLLCSIFYTISKSTKAPRTNTHIQNKEAKS